ncbi:MAG: hypothetical protein QM779_05020 [Propionicimonas sp.]|uniref:hypothetical protein n=1 Tax=Propionicimonas sp. TaxID=1955623 RepID=UPI003D1529EA
MRGVADLASRCRGLGTLIVVAALTGCAAFGLGGRNEPSPTAPVVPSQSAAPSPSPAPATSEPVTTPVDPAPSATTPRPTASASSMDVLRPAAAPTIEGRLRYGSELGFDVPRWGPGKVTLSYQWLRDGAAVAGATGTTLRLAAGDIGHSFSVRITGNRAGFTPLMQDSAAVGPVLGAQLRPATPEVTGTARVGHTLTSVVDAWGPGTVQLTRQWLRDDAPIAGATGRTYRLVAADLGHAIRVRVRGSRTNFETQTRTSEPTGLVAAGVLDPTPVPLYSGVGAVGQVLTALPRQWGPGEVSLAYQWYRSGSGGDVRIDQATKSTYKLAAADLGHRLKVRVTGSRRGFTPVTKYSAWTSEIQLGTLDPDTPTISGQAVVSKELTADPGTWKPAGVSFSYHWYRGTVLVTKATGPTYTLSGADVGYAITVKVTGSLPGYRDLTVASAPTDKVVPLHR